MLKVTSCLRACVIVTIAILSSPAFSCGENEYEECWRVDLGPLGEAKDCKCLPKVGGTVGQVGEESKRAVNNLARELGKTPEALQQCLSNVQRCANEIMSAPLALLAQAYIEGLYRQSEGRSRSFSPEWITMTQPYYDVDLRGVTYAENINTGHGQTLAYCDRIFFTHTGDPWADKNELFLTLHEMEHLVQCQKRGRRTFLAEYLLKGLVEIGKNGTFDVHDLHEFEQAADAKASQLTDMLWNQIQDARRAGRYSNRSGGGQCNNGEVYMNSPGGACCTPNYSRCRNLTTGAVTCGMGGC